MKREYNLFPVSRPTLRDPRLHSYQLSQRGLFSGGHPGLISGIHVRLVLGLRRMVVTAPAAPAPATELVYIVLLDPTRAGGPHAHWRRVITGRVLGRVVLDGQPVGVRRQHLRPEDAPLVRRRVRVTHWRPEPVVHGHRRKVVAVVVVVVVVRHGRGLLLLLRVDRQRLAASIERVVPVAPPVRLVLPVGNEAHLEMGSPSRPLQSRARA